MTTASTVWNAAELLQIGNLDADKWPCTGTTLKHKRCQINVAKADVTAAKRLLENLPGVANEAQALEVQLRRLAGLTLCKRWHVKMATQHDCVVKHWTDLIHKEQADRHALDVLNRPERLVRQIRSVDNTEGSPSREDPIVMARVVDPRQDSCAICLDHIGTNDGEETLPCTHNFCRGCISRWRRERQNCPLCRDDRDWTEQDRRPRGVERVHRREESQVQEAAPMREATPTRAAARRRVVEEPRLREEAVEARERVEAGQQALAGGQGGARYEEQETNEAPAEQGLEDADLECGICLETLGYSGGRRTLPCAHTFCVDCISHWSPRSSTCPYRCTPPNTEPHP